MLAICIAIASCSVTKQRQAEVTVLPSPDRLLCCWQSQEALVVTVDGSRLSMTAVSALQNEQLKVVLLDSLGRRFLTITQHGQLIQASPGEVADRFPVKLFLLGIYLRYLSDQEWQNIGAYRLQRSNIDQISLYDSGELKVSLTRLNSRALQLHYPETGIQVAVTVMQRTGL